MNKSRTIIHLDNFHECVPKMILTVLFFCEKCFDNEVPDLTDTALVYSNRFHYLRLEDKPAIISPHSYGFTPHIVILHEKYYSYVDCELTCGICGVRKEHRRNSITGEKVIKVARDKVDIHFLSLEEWNNLIENNLFKN